MSVSARRAIDSSTLGDVYAELGVLLDSGADAARALAIVSNGAGDAAVTDAMRRARAMVAGGATFAHAGHRAGLLRGLDLEIVQAAEHAGHLAAALRRLAESHAARAERARRMKSRLVLPAGVFVLAVFVAPLPALVAGTVSGARYLLGILALLGQVAAAGWLLWKLPGWLRARARRRSNAFDRWRLRVPLLGKLHQRREVLQVLESFELLYGAGVAPLDALRLAAAGATNGHVRERFAHALAALDRGEPLARALGASALLSPAAGHLLRTGDASGRLSEILRRVSATERGELRATDEQLAQWLPRLVYALVAVWMARQILGAHLTLF